MHSALREGIQLTSVWCSPRSRRRCIHFTVSCYRAVRSYLTCSLWAFGDLCVAGTRRRRYRVTQTGARVSRRYTSPLRPVAVRFSHPRTCAARRDHFTLPLQSERNGGAGQTRPPTGPERRGSEANIYTIRNEVSSRSIDLPERGAACGSNCGECAPTAARPPDAALVDRACAPL